MHSEPLNRKRKINDVWYILIKMVLRMCHAINQLSHGGIVQYRIYFSRYFCFQYIPYCTLPHAITNTYSCLILGNQFSLWVYDVVTVVEFSWRRVFWKFHSCLWKFSLHSQLAISFGNILSNLLCIFIKF